VGEPASRHLPQGLDHDRDDGRGEPQEHRLDERGVPERDVDPGQREQRHDAWQHEQDAGDQRAANAVEQPADVGGELLRLRPRKQGAVAEREQEPVLADPAVLVDESPLHDRDLAGRSARRSAARSGTRPWSPF
jgi:hypothetical protein